MGSLRREIEQYLTIAGEGTTDVSAQFLFPPEFLGFQGHFPQKAVLPGVCHVQCAMITMERGGHLKADLREIVQAKYFSPVGPNEEITCVCSISPAEGGDLNVKAVFSKGGTRVSELKLRVHRQGA